jgi:hypothetical protein
MAMADGLASCRAIVDAYVVAVWCKLIVQFCFGLLNQFQQVIALGFGQLKKGPSMPPRDNQRMARRNGVAIKDGKTAGIAGQQLALAQSAERAGFACSECCHGGILGSIGAEVKMIMNIRFNYLYRDAGNFKQYGSGVFCNPRNLSLGEIERKLQQSLMDGRYFVAEDVNLPALRKFDFDASLDHDWHEFESVEHCEDPCPEKLARDVSALIVDLARMSSSDSIRVQQPAYHALT